MGIELLSKLLNSSIDQSDITSLIVNLNASSDLLQL